MEFGKIHVKIKGLTPLLMNKVTAEDLKGDKLKAPGKKYVPEKEAARKAYIDVIDGKKQLYIPNTWIHSMLVKAGAYFGAKLESTSKKVPLSSIIAGSIRIEPEKIPLGTDKYEIDERPVNIKQNRVLAWRPRLNEWEAEFDIVYMKDYFNEAVIVALRKALEDGGIRLGIGDFRPQHKGWFGTFAVEKFEVDSEG